MFRLIDAKRYRCLKDVSQRLNPFEILVGPNASGKSTFLDVIAFLGDFMTDGLAASVERRTANFHDLVWGRQKSSFEFLVEAQIPPGRRHESVISAGLDRIEYLVAFQLDPEEENLQVFREAVHLVGESRRSDPIVFRASKSLRFASESIGETFERQPSPNYSCLTALPTDDVFPATAWLRESLRLGITTVQLSRVDLERPSPRGRGDDPKRITGSGLARSISQLKINDQEQFQDWLAHIRTALPDVRMIDSVLREEDRHRYIMIEYENGVRVPQWMLSEGTLRLLALTILAYLPNLGVYLIEEPENGVHPTALETIYQSLSSVYEAQVLVASHSPVLLSMAKPEQILCFSKTPDGTKIIRGSDHPALQEWQGEVSLGDMVASGILG